MGIGNFLLKLANVRCPNCSYQLKMRDLQRAQLSGMFQCPKCQHAIANKANDSSIPSKLEKSNVVATRQVKVTTRGSEFRVEIKWLSRSSGFIISFALVWNSIIGLISYIFFFAKVGRIQNGPISFLVMGLFGLAGLQLIYLALCEIFNTTRILVKANKIAFWTKPFSMNATQVINVADIVNFSLERRDGGKQNSRRVFKHFVNIQLRNGNSIPLCRVQNMNEGMYVEKLLESKLGLVDDPSLDRVEF